MNNLLWTPSKKRIEEAQISAFKNALNQEHGLNLESYADLHTFSVTKKDLFWKFLITYFDVDFEGYLDPALLEEGFENYTWFTKTKLNFAQNLLKNGNDSSIAINFQHESKLSKKITYKELRTEVKALQTYLKTILKSGEVLAAYMPNVPETAFSMLATTSIGGVFTSTSCDFGIEGVLDRFGQSNPKVLVAAVGYMYGEKYFDLQDKLAEIESRIPSLEKIILVDFLGRGYDLSRFKKAVDYKDIISKHVSDSKIEFQKVSFNHPLYIMYSSGTTGKPKCIVHSQGGTLIQLIKEHALHCDITDKKKVFYFTTCGWMMWNWLVSSLYFGCEVVLYEGSPASPSPEYFFNIIEREGIHVFGTSPKFLKALEDTNAKFKDYPTLETILSTGSPLLPEQYDFVYNKIKKDVLLGSISGGTDIVSCFMLASPIVPVYRGEIQAKGLGMDIKALDDHGNSVIGLEGELVCAQTFPSRPIYFLDDTKNTKIKAAYFDQIKGVWTHGDFIKVTENGGVIVYGRSDATLNPGGVRIGTAEIYRQTEGLHYILDSLCVGRPNEGDVDVILFVKLKNDEFLSNERKKEIKDLIKKNTTPRHVPREIYVVSDIPYTRSGKKVELAVTRILAKKPVTNTEALVNPESLKEYEQYI
ncbi:MAG: acetoacetate--CoA ligase [Bdellovibrionales bacterium]|nr:acetoacetate--CoA ligase [Bdellovibrionales bacterium]